MEAVLDGRLAVSAAYRDRLATCTGCLACEAQCPAGVPVTTIIHAAKEQAVAESGPGVIGAAIAASLRRPALMRSLAWLAPTALHFSGRAVKGQGSGVKGKRARSAERGVRSDGGTGRTANGRVLFFPGCAVSYFQQDIGRDAAAVLGGLGYEVVVPEGLVCCGRPFLSLGDRETAAELARKNSAVLAGLDADVVVTACASCGLTFKRDYPGLLASSGRKPVAVLDIHELLAGKLDALELAAGPSRITVHDPCHLGRGQGLAKALREVLRQVPGTDLVKMTAPERCCGFGGVMRATHPGLSQAIGAAKAEDIVRTGAQVVVTGCPGCRMQIADSLRRAGSDAMVLHTVQVIEAAMRNAGCRIRDAEGTAAGAKGRP